MLRLTGIMAEILATNIRTLRISRAETQTEFADTVDASQGMVSRWEKGSQPGQEYLIKMARLGRTTVEAFATRLWQAPQEAQAAGEPSLNDMLFLRVALPSEDGLTRMFVNLLEGVDAADAGTARELARQLPTALGVAARLEASQGPGSVPTGDEASASVAIDGDASETSPRAQTR